jgi:hypothetical protein
VDLTDPSGEIANIAIACLTGGLTRSAIGFLAGRKTDAGDLGRGFLRGCAEGALFAIGAGLIARGLPAVKALLKACNCFPAGTPVATEHGEKPIEQIRAGDRVWSRNSETGRAELHTVVGLFQKTATELFTISAGETSFAVTPEHPLWVVGRGWVDAGDVRVGDELLRRDGGTHRVTAVTSDRTATTVHNFEVEGDHNYFATDLDVLVHNCKIRPRAPMGTPATVGHATSTNYRATFFAQYPHLQGQVRVHHAIEQQLLKKYPGLFTAAEIHSLENLRGIPNAANNSMHLSQIRKLWNAFYAANPNATRQQVLDFATAVDDALGHLFWPPFR